MEVGLHKMRIYHILDVVIVAVTGVCCTLVHRKREIRIQKKHLLHFCHHSTLIRQYKM